MSNVKHLRGDEKRNCSRLPWKQVHRHAYTLPQVTQTCGRVKWQGRGHSSESAVTLTVNSYRFTTR